MHIADLALALRLLARPGQALEAQGALGLPVGGRQPRFEHISNTSNGNNA